MGCDKLGVAGVTRLADVNLTVKSASVVTFEAATVLANLNLDVSESALVLFPAASSYTGYNTSWNVVIASAAISVIPVFVLFIVLQRYLRDGITTTGIK